MELYYEQNVVNHNIDEHAKKTKILNFAKTACIVVAVFIVLSSTLFMTDSSMLFMIGVVIATAVPFAIAAWVLGRINKRHNTEYDYVVDDENIRISAVYFRAKRKLLHTVRLRNVESVGVFESDGYKKAAASAEKKIMALVNYENEKTIIYILFNTEKGKRILFIEPDRGFMMTLRRAVASYQIFDRSVSDFERELALIETANDPVKSNKADNANEQAGEN